MEFTNGQILSAAATLASIIAFFWHIIYSNHKIVATKLDKCESDHKESSKKMFEMHGRIERMEGERAGVLKGVDKIAQDVIDEVRRIREEG